MFAGLIFHLNFNEKSRFLELQKCCTTRITCRPASCATGKDSSTTKSIELWPTSMKLAHARGKHAPRPPPLPVVSSFVHSHRMPSKRRRRARISRSDKEKEGYMAKMLICVWRDIPKLFISGFIHNLWRILWSKFLQSVSNILRETSVVPPQAIVAIFTQPSERNMLYRVFCYSSLQLYFHCKMHAT